MPIVSIILPTYKNPPHLLRAIKSVFEQSFSDWELIIIDDGLTVEAKQKVLDFIKKDSRTTISSNPHNSGIQKSLNNGLSLAKGGYIARIDDDDQWIDKDKLKKQVGFFNTNPEYVLVGTDAVICDEKLKDLQIYIMPKSDLEIRNRILFKNCFLHSAVLIRKSVLDKVGRYLEEKRVRHVEDYDLWLRLGLRGRIINLDIKAVRIMVSSDSVTCKNRLKQAQRDLVLTFCYRRDYSYFCFALVIGLLRLVFFYINLLFPVPKRVLYKIQAMYKAI